MRLSATEIVVASGWRASLAAGELLVDNHHVWSTVGR